MFVEELNEDTFVLGKGTVIIDFWAPWCGPCRSMSPFLEEVAEKYASDISTKKVDIQRNMNLALRYGIRSIPCLVVFKDGVEADRVVGFSGKQALIDLFEENK